MASGEQMEMTNMFMKNPAHRNVRVILFNGPPSSGKDTSAFLLEAAIVKALGRDAGEVIQAKFAACLKEDVHRYLGLPEQHNFYEMRKDQRLPQFRGATPREAYINFSEGFGKATFGQTYWIERFWERASARIASIVAVKPETPVFFLVSDAGFQVEVDFLLKVLNPQQICLFGMRRAGKDFSNDSRGPVHLPQSAQYAVENSGTYEDLETKVVGYFKDYLHRLGNNKLNQIANRL